MTGIEYRDRSANWEGGPNGAWDRRTRWPRRQVGFKGAPARFKLRILKRKSSAMSPLTTAPLVASELCHSRWRAVNVYRKLPAGRHVQAHCERSHLSLAEQVRLVAVEVALFSRSGRHLKYRANCDRVEIRRDGRFKIPAPEFLQQ
jgi:hypothetical protein